MAEPYIGQIIPFGGSFAILNWAMCNGQPIQISQNSALFSILGTTYGGDGKTFFLLPDLQGRVPIHFGHGKGLSPYVLGQVGGAESTTLTAGNLPQAPVFIPASDAQANTAKAVGNVPAGGVTQTGAPVAGYTSPANSQGSLAAAYVQGGSQAFGLLQPYLAINWLIAIQGLFPPRP